MRVGDAEVIVLADEDSVAREAAARTVAALRAALDAHGSAHLALTGGSSAIPLYRVLAADPWRHAIPWHQVHLWWGDERFVPRDHPESNAGLAYRILLAIGAHAGESGTGAEAVDVLAGAVPGLPVDVDKVHPIPTEEAIADGHDTHWAAQAYADEIERLVPKNAAGVPAFDAILLGVGPDGHTLSVFPGSPALAPTAPIVVATPAPEHVEPHLPRVTLATRVLPAAGAVIVMASGSGKQEVLGRILGAERDPARWPAQAAILPNAVWLLDEAVAARVGAS